MVEKLALKAGHFWSLAHRLQLGNPQVPRGRELLKFANHCPGSGCISTATVGYQPTGLIVVFPPTNIKTKSAASWDELS